MGYEIRSTGNQPPRDAEILAVLRREFPDKEFAIHNGTIVESYRTQPDYDTMLENAPWYRARAAAAERAVAVVTDPADNYIDRVMSNDV